MKAPVVENPISNYRYHFYPLIYSHHYKPSETVYMRLYFGIFLKSKIEMKDMEANLISGQFSLSNMDLNVEKLSACLKEAGLPITIIDGFAAKISASAVWQLMRDKPLSIELDGLQLTLHVKNKHSLDAAKRRARDLVNSMINSFSSAEGIAEHVLEKNMEDPNFKESPDEDESGLKGIQTMIEELLSRIHIICKNTTIRIEMDEDSIDNGTKTAIELSIGSLEFLDELLYNKINNIETESNAKDPKDTKDFKSLKESVPNLETKKLINFESVKIYTNITAKNNMDSNSTIASPPSERSVNFENDLLLSTEDEIFASAVESFHSCGSTEQSTYLHHGIQRTTLTQVSVEKKTLPVGQQTIADSPILVAVIDGPGKISVQLNNMSFNPRYDQSFEHKFDINIILNGMKLFATPTQLAILKKLITNFSPSNIDLEIDEKEMDTFDNTGFVQKMNQDDLYHLDEVSKGFDVGDRVNSDKEFFAFPSTKKINPPVDQFVELNKTNKKAVAGSSRKTFFSDGDDISLGNMTRHGSTSTLMDNRSDRKPEMFILKAQITNLFAIITHKDPLSLESVKKNPERSIDDCATLIKSWSDNFFEKSVNINLDECSNLVSQRNAFNKLYEDDHLRFIFGHVVINAAGEKAFEGNTTTVGVELFNCDTVEFLMPESNTSSNAPTLIHLLNFENKKNDKMLNKNEHIHLEIINKSNHTNLEVTFAPCKMEIDFSLIDRLSNLICNIPFFGQVNGKDFAREATKISAFDETSDGLIGSGESKTVESVTICLKCENIEVDLRFPKADLRKDLASQKLPYYVRNVYDEYLNLVLEDISVKLPKISFEEIINHFSVQLNCTTISGTLVGDPKMLNCLKDDLKFLYASSKPDSPSISLSFLYDKRDKFLQQSTMETSTDTTDDGYYNLADNTMEGPFIRKKGIHENTSLIMPKQKADLLKFKKNNEENSIVSISITVPDLKVLLPSHEFYEIIYNRFGNDLALWEPSAPCFRPNLENYLDTDTNFQPCKDRGHYNDESFSSNGNYSRNDISFNRNDKGVEIQSNFVIVSLTAENSHILVCPENIVKDGEATIDIFDSHALINSTNTTFCFINGYKGDSELSYCYISNSTISVNHENHGEHIDSIDKDVKSPGFGKSVKSVAPEKIVPMKPDFGLCQFIDDNSLSIAIQLRMEPLNKRHIILAVSTCNSMIHFEPLVSPERLWINQLVKFFDAKDYLVPGYEIPDPLIELHVNIQSTVISHSQSTVVKSSPYTLRFAIGSCVFQSKFIQNVEMAQMVCILEDSALFMYSSEKANELSSPKMLYLNSASNIPKHNHVKVMACSHLTVDIAHANNLPAALKLKKPLIKINCVNDEFVVWLCSDTAHILLRIVTEIAEANHQIELLKKENDEKRSNKITSEDIDAVYPSSSTQYMPIHDYQNNATSTPIASSSGVLKTKKIVPNSIEDKLCDAIDSIPERKCNNKVFIIDHNFDSPEYLKQDDVASDDEFCDLSKDVGSGITDRVGSSRIRNIYKTNNPDCKDIRFQDDFFTAVSEENITDIINTTSFNIGLIYEFIIEKMSLKIYLYGGSDFGSFVKEQQKSYSKWELEKHLSDCANDNSVGGYCRDSTVCVSTVFKDISLSYKIFDRINPLQRMINFAIGNISVEDHLLISKIKAILHRLDNQVTGAVDDNPFLCFKMAENHMKEARVKMGLSSMKLNGDQDTLTFLYDFSTDILNNFTLPDTNLIQTSDSPVLDVSRNEPEEDSFPDLAELPKSEEPDHYQYKHDPMTASMYIPSEEKAFIEEPAAIHNGTDTFIKNFIFHPACVIKFDYENKRFNSEPGVSVGLLFAFTKFKGSEMVLKEIRSDKGTLGFKRCFEKATEEWYNNLIGTQMGGLIKGLVPASPFFNMYTGFRDLIYMPVEELYKEDGHLVKGIQRGASSFTVSTLTAVIEIGQSVTGWLENITQFSLDCVKPDSHNSRREIRQKKPASVLEGFNQAAAILITDITDKRNLLVQATCNQDSGEYTAARVANKIPESILITTKAAVGITHTVLQGLRSNLNPKEYKEEQQKYK
uniref:Chorein_N domain-containing protein n=1 Tax=Rhabditophanes sp. KR3021 TaxID=114890 RepID=A0AC35U5C9_9BILA